MTAVVARLMFSCSDCAPRAPRSWWYVLGRAAIFHRANYFCLLSARSRSRLIGGGSTCVISDQPFYAEIILFIILGLWGHWRARWHAGLSLGVPEVAAEAADRPRRGEFRQGLEGGGWRDLWTRRDHPRGRKDCEGEQEFVIFDICQPAIIRDVCWSKDINSVSVVPPYFKWDLTSHLIGRRQQIKASDWLNNDLRNLETLPGCYQLPLFRRL